jgi:hypothetical protein
MHPDLKTTFGVLQWIANRWLDIEACWMNVRIDRPRTRDNVSFGLVKVEGTYRADLRKDMALFHRAGNVYFPQGPPVIGETKGRWNGRVHVGENQIGQHSIVIAIVSPDIRSLLQYHDKVHDETQRWVGIRWNVLPPGLRILDQIEVYGVKPD